MITRADKVADAIVTHFYEDMQDPKMRGRNFDPNTFNIENWVNIHLFMYYRTKGYPKSDVRQRALIRARKLWNELWNISSPSQLPR